jgi:hypothetical protein
VQRPAERRLIAARSIAARGVRVSGRRARRFEGARVEARLPARARRDGSSHAAAARAMLAEGGAASRRSRGTTMRKLALSAAAVVLACAGPALAQQTEEGVLGSVEAPRKAFELGLSTGYTQGFGAINAAPGGLVGDIARGGLGVGLDLGYRIDPRLSFGVTGQYQELQGAAAQPPGFRARGAMVGVQAAFHALPYQRVDPWVSLGTGYRMLWSVPPGPAPNLLSHGFELAKLGIGLDVRISRDVALGPMIGGGLDMFFWQSPQGGVGNVAIADKRVSSFVFGGIGGRFDLGGTRERAPVEARVGQR